MSDWQAIIREAARTRFYRNGDAETPFLLARADMIALVREIDPVLFARASPNAKVTPDGYLRIQARVYVSELQMQVMVDEWTAARFT